MNIVYRFTVRQGGYNVAKVNLAVPAFQLTQLIIIKWFVFEAITINLAS